MKKGLVAIAVLVACVFGFTGAALAAEFGTEGVIEFKLTGTNQEGEASGLFEAGDVEVCYSLTLTSGNFETFVSPKLKLAGELDCDDAYIKWSPDTLSVTMKPIGIDKELYDIEGNGGKPNIPKNPGLGFEVPVAPFTFDLAVNNQKETVGDGVKFSYGLGVEYVINSVTLGGLFGSTDVEDADWYGSYYGGKVAVDLAPLTLEGQYGSFSPEAAGLEDGSGLFAKFGYDLGEGLGSVALEYTSVDKNFNGAGTATAKDYSKIYGEYSYPLTEAVSLTLDVANIEPGTGVDSYTEYEVKMGVSL